MILILFLFSEPPIEVLQEIRKRKLKEEAGKKERKKEKEKTEL